MTSAALAAPSSGLVCLSTSDTGDIVVGRPVVSINELRMARVRRGLLSAASVIEEELQESGVRYRAALVTCTYRPGVTWEPRQITATLKCLREWARRRGIWVRTLWRFEFGERTGRPHYHVVVWLPRGITMPMWDRQGWWPHGMTNAVWARRPVPYLAKYAAKASAVVWAGNTRGARWFGVAGLSVAGRLRALWRSAPRWVRERWPEGDPLKRLGSSWWRFGTFVELRSPYRCREACGGVLEFAWVGWTAGDIRFC
jgi:hypothetical protein